MMMSPALLGAVHSAMIAGAAACPSGLACGWGNYCRAGATVVPGRQVGGALGSILKRFGGENASGPGPLPWFDAAGNMPACCPSRPAS